MGSNGSVEAAEPKFWIEYCNRKLTPYDKASGEEIILPPVAIITLIAISKSIFEIFQNNICQ